MGARTDWWEVVAFTDLSIYLSVRWLVSLVVCVVLLSVCLGRASVSGRRRRWWPGPKWPKIGKRLLL